MQIHWNMASKKVSPKLDKKELGSKRISQSETLGFFTIIFNNIKDIEKIFQEDPYFMTSDGLFMKPWVPQFNLEKEYFSSVPIWILLYPLLQVVL